MQTVQVSLTRKGKVFSLDTECLALGQIRVDLDALPASESRGTAKRLLGSSVLYCFIGSFADALQARKAEFREISGNAVVTAGDDGTGRTRVLGITVNVEVEMDAVFNDTFEHVKKIMQRGCLISASLEPAFPITYNVSLRN